MKIRNVTLESLKPFLKASKSPPVDNGPYSMEYDHAGWWTVHDKTGSIVGQLSKEAGAYVASYEP